MMKNHLLFIQTPVMSNFRECIEQLNEKIILHKDEKYWISPKINWSEIQTLKESWLVSNLVFIYNEIISNFSIWFLKCIQHAFKLFRTLELLIFPKSISHFEKSLESFRINKNYKLLRLKLFFVWHCERKMISIKRVHHLKVFYPNKLFFW